MTMFGWLGKMLRLPVGPQGMLGGVTRSQSDPPKRGTREHLEVYETSPWPRAVGDKVATAVACSNFRLLAVSRNGKAVRDSRLQKAPMDVRTRLLGEMNGSVREITEHPFLSALDSPNPYMDRMALLKLTEVYVDFVGDAFWLKDRNGLTTPAGYWPIPPHWVMETPTTDKPTFRFGFRGWQAHVPASEIVWFHEPAPANPYTRGTGVGWTLGDEIQVDEYAAKMAAAFFFNRARPDFVFVTGMGEEETKRLEMDWNNRLQGFWRAHRPYFLQGDADLQKQIREFQQPTMEQLVYPGLRKVQRDIILQVWGVPPEMFGIVENSNRATIEAAEYLFTKWVVAPKAERMRGVLQRAFVEDFDERGILHVDSPVMEDKEHRLNVVKAAPHIVTVDEWRDLAGFKPAGGDLGKSRLLPMNSYLTVDPLDLETRPESNGGGAAAAQVGLASKVLDVEREKAMFGAIEKLGQAQPIALRIEAPAAPNVTVEGMTVHVEAAAPQLLPAPEVNVKVEAAAPLVIPAPLVTVDMPPMPPAPTELTMHVASMPRQTMDIESMPARVREIERDGQERPTRLVDHDQTEA